MNTTQRNEGKLLSPVELKQLRKILFLSTKEAANLIGNGTLRSWNRYETGDRAIPQNVSNKVIELVTRRGELITEDSPSSTQKDSVYRPSHSTLMLCLAQSVLAHKLAEEVAL